MTDFDFHNLLFPAEFERLCRDILEIRDAPLKFRTFGDWKDNGVDIECTTENTNIIGQCKRYAQSRYSALKVSLKKEVAKCKRRHPKRYILCVSLTLGESQFEEIVQLFDGYLKKDDILDRDRLNQYLGQIEYEHLKKSYSKLLVPNLYYIELLLNKIVNRKYYADTELFLKDISKYHKLYYNTQSLTRCIDILEENRVLILTGKPGVGKTTTAKMIANYYINRKVKNILITTGNKLEEIYSLPRDEEQYLIVIDDFWGAKFSDEYKDDLKLRNFVRIIDDIKNSPNIYLVLTSRDYIIKDVLNHAEYEAGEILKTDTFTINIDKYDIKEKVRIFLNHLIFYDFEKYYFDYLKYDDALERIVNHENYSPRHIEFFIKRYLKIENQNTYNFYKKFIEYLDKPQAYWNENFKKLSKTSQLILLVLLTSSDPIDLIDLEKIFGETQKDVRIELNKNIIPDDFNLELKVLEDFFIVTDKQEYSNQVLVRFQSPGIKDYILEYLRNDGKSWIKPLIENAQFFNQLNFVFDTKESEIDDYDSDTVLFGEKIVLSDKLQKILKTKILNEFHSLNFCTQEQRDFAGELSNYHSQEETKYWKLFLLNKLFDISLNKNKDIRDFIINEVQKDIEGYDPKNREIVNWRSMPEFPRVIRMIQPFVQFDAKQLIISYYKSITFTNEFDSLYEFKEIFPTEFEEFYRENIKEIRKSIRWLIIDDIDYYIDDDMEVEIDILLDLTIEKVFKKYGLRLTSKFINEIEELTERPFRNFKKTDKSNVSKPERSNHPIKEGYKTRQFDKIIDEYLPNETYGEFNAVQFIKNYNLNKNQAEIFKKELCNDNSILNSYTENEQILSAIIDFIINQNINISKHNRYTFFDTFFSFYCESKNLDKNVLKKVLYQLSINSFSNCHSITRTQIYRLFKEYYISNLTVKSLYPIIIPDNHWFNFSSNHIKIYFIVENIREIELDEKFKNEIIELSHEIYDPIFLEFLQNTCPQKINEKVIIPELKRLTSLIDTTSNQSLVLSFINFFKFKFELELDRKKKQFVLSSSSVSEGFIELILQYLIKDFSIMDLGVFFDREYYTEENKHKYYIKETAYKNLYEVITNSINKRKGKSFINNREEIYYDIKLYEFVSNFRNYMVLKEIGMEDFILDTFKNIQRVIKNISTNS